MHGKEIFETIGSEAMYMQLAEEATELAKASIKVARILHATNPTNITMIKAYQNLIEEFTDVIQCSMYLGLKADVNQMKQKDERWFCRIKDNYSNDME